MMIEEGIQKVFEVNDHLALKLDEDGKTIIYVAGKPFRQCKYLLINIPVEEVSSLDEIESIDEVAEKLDKSLEPLRGRKQFKYNIPPDTEFWGHCSNLQVWYEHGYNTRLLHANLAFGLLRELTRVGDTQAKRVFKEEVAERYNNGVESVRKYLRSMKYLKYFSIEEFLNLMQDEKERDAIEQLRESYPRFETHERGGTILKINIDIKKGRVVKLDLSRLELKQIPECICLFTVLENLIISYNLLETLPEWIGDFKALKILETTDNLLLTLPKGIENLQNLEELYTRGNQIKNLPESIGNLKALKTFELYKNHLVRLPDTIGNLTKLKSLDLHENKLTYLPESIGNLTNLETLILKGNLLGALPISIGDLKNLKTLVVANNRIKKLPRSIVKIQKMKLLSISGNPLQNFPEFIYKFPKLDELFIRELGAIKLKIKKENFGNKYITIYSD